MSSQPAAAAAIDHQGDNEPDPRAVDHLLGRVALDFAAADDAIRALDLEGVHAGDRYDRAVTKWREAYNRLRRVAHRYQREDARGG